MSHANTPTGPPPGDMLSREQVLAVLDERARKLAQAPDSAATRTPVAQVAVVVVGSEPDGIPVEAITAVLQAPRIAPLPGLPPWMPGIVQVRGDLLSVVDLSRWFRVGAGVRCPYLVVLAGPDGILGLLAESVGEFRTVYADEIALSLREHAARSGRPFRSTTRDLLTIIDPVRLFQDRKSVV